VTTSNSTKQPIQQQDQQIIQGIAQDLQTMPNLYLGGTAFTPQSLSALFQSRITAADAVSTAKANWLAAVQAFHDLDKEVRPIARDLRHFVSAAFGPASGQLADFGFTPRAPTPTARPARSRSRNRRTQEKK
jgi:hypothetical protein